MFDLFKRREDNFVSSFSTLKEFLYKLRILIRGSVDSEGALLWDCFYTFSTQFSNFWPRSSFKRFISLYWISRLVSCYNFLSQSTGLYSEWYMHFDIVFSCGLWEGDGFWSSKFFFKRLVLYTCILYCKIFDYPCSVKCMPGVCMTCCVDVNRQ